MGDPALWASFSAPAVVPIVRGGAKWRATESGSNASKYPERENEWNICFNAPRTLAPKPQNGKAKPAGAFKELCRECKFQGQQWSFFIIQCKREQNQYGENDEDEQWTQQSETQSHRDLNSRGGVSFQDRVHGHR